MKKQVQDLEKQRDFLRSQLRSQREKFGKMDRQILRSLNRLDELFLNTCKFRGIALDEYGRLS